MNPRPPRRGGSGRKRSSAPRKASGPAVEPLHPTVTPPDVESFESFTLDPAVQAAIRAMGITRPTPIQALAIQPVLDGRDVIAQAETGTGKTLAFGSPMISRVEPGRVSVLGLVLTPTRELAEQVAKVMAELGTARGIRVALIVGGEPMGPQVQALKDGAQVVVGTPGRVLDLYGQGFLSFPWTEFVVLDEADEMLEIGFIDDVKEILKRTPDERQTLLFSATFPTELLRLAREHTRNPVEVATARGVATVDTIAQDWFEVEEDDRPLALIRLIEQSTEDDIFLVFCERRTEVERLMRRLERLPYSIKALHGGYDQASRFRVMSSFREKQVKALIATDVASRGLDVVHVTRVVNFSVPRDVTAYTHRIGRTGRAGREGRATTLVTPRTQTRWRAIERAASWDIPKSEPPGRQRETESGRPAREARRGGSHEPRREAPTEARRERAREPRRASAEEAPRVREERPQRDARRPREERPVPEARTQREERPAREARTAREERPARAVREERPTREERPAREARTQREERPPRDARAPREERKPREAHRTAEERRPRTERHAPEERAPVREERPERRSRSEEPARPEAGRRRSAPAEAPREEAHPRRARRDEERPAPKREREPAPERAARPAEREPRESGRRNGRAERPQVAAEPERHARRPAREAEEPGRGHRGRARSETPPARDVAKPPRTRPTGSFGDGL